MDNSTTISWIFLSIVLSSDKSPVDFKGISQVADGINHAVPSHKEIQDSVSWLLRKDFILKIGNKYSLSDLGKAMLIDSEKNTKTVLNIWKNIDNKIRKYDD
jgi:predicted transcriptional regulator